MNRRVDLVDCVDHPGHRDRVGTVESRPRVLRDELTFGVERERVEAFREGGIVELSEETGHCTSLCLADEEVDEKVCFNADRDDEHLKQEANVATISVFEFLSLLPEQRAPRLRCVLAVINEEVHLTVNVI